MIKVYMLLVKNQNMMKVGKRVEYNVYKLRFTL